MRDTGRSPRDPRPEARDQHGRLWDGDIVTVTEPNGSTTALANRAGRRLIRVRAEGRSR